MDVQPPSVTLYEDIREYDGEPRNSCEKARDFVNLVALVPECVCE